MEREWLLGEFKRRKGANPSYSLRSFSRATKIQPGRLSELLAGKRRLTPKMAKRIAVELGSIPMAQGQWTALEEETFSAISDWQHFAILSLLETKDFRENERWIARRLGISVLEARDSLERLIRLGIVERRENKLLPARGGFTTSQYISSAALRRSHRQSLEQAIEALEGVRVEDRDISSVTMAIDTRKLPQAKRIIRDFRRSLMRLLEAGESDEVYNLNIQLIPVSKKGQS